MRYLIATISIIGLAWASHLMGGEIILECLNPNTNPPTYRIRVRVYRDCDGILQPSTITIRRQSSSCGVNSTITLTRVSVNDITPLCPGEQSRCNGNGPYGWEEHVYEGTIQLQNCNDWILSFTSCCRNSGITTGSANEEFFIFTRVNTLDAPCNNTPRFNNPPTALACAGQQFCFNPGMSDPDGDRLEVSLTNCRATDINTPVTYNGTCPGGCSGSNPLPSSSPPTVNTTNGTVCLNPSAVAVGPVCILVREYRGNTLIGEYIRDQQVRVISCSGSPPKSSAINGTLPANPYNPNNPGTYTAYFCPGSNQCFNLQFRDPENDPVTVSWTNLPPGATFNVTNNNTPTPNGQFCWNPTAAQVGTHTFYVTLQDNNCPLRNTATYGFTIVVSNQPPNPINFIYNCGTTVIVEFNAPVQCNSVASNGSDFQFMTAGAPTITGATPLNCSGGYTQQVQLTLSSPFSSSGNYVLRIRNGTDGNTVCGDAVLMYVCPITPTSPCPSTPTAAA